MANPEHLKILKQGVKAWNKWGHEHPEIIPDFSGANLRGANLSSADLSEANLRGANLSDANLSSAEIIGAELFGANLSNADLRGADLRGANLSGVELIGAGLFGANLSEAWLGANVFADNDLSEVNGLETVAHHGPSTIGIDTLYRSGGKLPEAFLRGAGVPDIFIKYLPSLVSAEQAIQFYSCFISYSTKGEEFSKRLHSRLRDEHVRVWFAPEDLKIGDRFRIKIDEVIRVYDKLLVVLSEHSVQSAWVEKEVETAMEREREQKRTMLFPIRVDDVVNEIKTGWPADIRRTRHIGDFANWKDHDAFEQAFKRLLKDLQPEATAKPPNP